MNGEPFGMCRTLFRFVPVPAQLPTHFNGEILYIFLVWLDLIQTVVMF